MIGRVLFFFLKLWLFLVLGGFLVFVVLNKPSRPILSEFPIGISLP